MIEHIQGAIETVRVPEHARSGRVTFGTARLVLGINNERAIDPSFPLEEALKKADSSHLPHAAIAQVSENERKTGGVTNNTFTEGVMKFQEQLLERYRVEGNLSADRLDSNKQLEQNAYTNGLVKDSVAIMDTFGIMDALGINKTHSLFPPEEAIAKRKEDIDSFREKYLGGQTDVEGVAKELIGYYKNKEYAYGKTTEGILNWQKSLLDALDSQYTSLFFHVFGGPDTATLLLHDIRAMVLLDSSFRSGKEELLKAVQHSEFLREMEGDDKEAFSHLARVTGQQETGFATPTIEELAEEELPNPNAAADESGKIITHPADLLDKPETPGEDASPSPTVSGQGEETPPKSPLAEPPHEMLPSPEPTKGGIEPELRETREGGTETIKASTIKYLEEQRDNAVRELASRLQSFGVSLDHIQDIPFTDRLPDVILTTIKQANLEALSSDKLLKSALGNITQKSRRALLNKEDEKAASLRAGIRAQLTTCAHSLLALDYVRNFEEGGPFTLEKELPALQELVSAEEYSLERENYAKSGNPAITFEQSLQHPIMIGGKPLPLFDALDVAQALYNALPDVAKINTDSNEEHEQGAVNASGDGNISSSPALPMSPPPTFATNLTESRIRNSDTVKQQRAAGFEQKGSGLVEQKNYEEAVRAFDNALKINPTGKAFILKGNALLKLNRPDEAVLAYDNAIHLNPRDENASTALKRKAYVLTVQKNYPMAVSTYQEAIKLNPDDEEANAQLSKLLFEQMRNYPEARAAAERALRVNPRNGIAGNVLHHLNSLNS